MKTEVKNAIEQYQCSGCVGGSDISCYEKGYNQECDKHVAGTMVSGIGSILLGMPKGFNRLGPGRHDVKIYIFENCEDSWCDDKFNIAIWKTLDNGNTIVRGLHPRLNLPFYHVIPGDCMDKFNCREITAEEIGEMD